MEVMTAEGPVAAERLGMTLPHEHIFSNLSRDLGLNGLLDDPEVAKHDLRCLFDAGGRTLVEVSPVELRGDVTVLRDLARRTGLHLVLGTSFYRDSYYDHPTMNRLDADELAQRLVVEIRDGIRDERPATSSPSAWREAGTDPGASPAPRPGVIGELGWDGFRATAAEERAFRAAARAHHETGLTISTHAARGAGLRQIALLVEEGVAPRRVVVGHCDTVSDSGYHLAVAETGAWVQFDTFAHATSDWDVARRVRWVVDLVDAGYADRILLSNDYCVRSNARHAGGRGYCGVFDTLLPALGRAGLAKADAVRLVTENPQRALAGG